MVVKITLKNYGRGKKRIILINQENNFAFVSFGEKDICYEYLYKQYLKQQDGNSDNR